MHYPARQCQKVFKYTRIGLPAYSKQPDLSEVPCRSPRELLSEPFCDEPLDGVWIIGRDGRNSARIPVELQRDGLVSSCSIEVVPALEIAGTPDPPSLAPFAYAKSLHGSDYLVRDLLRAPEVIPAQDDAVVIQGDPV
jgi:hypothetical protein